MIISVASGKGGTGKTLVATSLAIALAGRERVQLLDCDVEEPNAHIFLKPVIAHRQPVLVPVPVVEEQKCTHCGKCAEVCAFHALSVLPKEVLVFPYLCHGCGACVWLCPENAITEKGREIGVVETGKADTIGFAQGRLTIGEPMAPPVIKKVKEQAEKSGIVIIDAPPGTACPVVETVRGSDFCLLVTEPTPFGCSDLSLAVEMVRRLGIPCGVVLNRAGVGDQTVQDYCAREGLPIMLSIPYYRMIAVLYSRGITPADGISYWRQAFKRLAEDIERVSHARISRS